MPYSETTGFISNVQQCCLNWLLKRCWFGFVVRFANRFLRLPSRTRKIYQTFISHALSHYQIS